MKVIERYQKNGIDWIAGWGYKKKKKENYRSGSSEAFDETGIYCSAEKAHRKNKEEILSQRRTVTAGMNSQQPILPTH